MKPNAIACTVIAVVAMLLPRPGLAQAAFSDIQKYHVGDIQLFGGFVSDPDGILHEFDGDGIGDLVLFRSWDEGSDTLKAVILRGNADGTFLAPMTVALGSFDTSKRPATLILDLNGDGLDDILVKELSATDPGWHEAINTGTDVWSCGMNFFDFVIDMLFGFSMSVPLTGIDCDGDGIEEIVGGSQDCPSQGAFCQPVVLYNQRVDPTEENLYTVPTDGFVWWTDAGTGDFNGDGVRDFMERSYYDGVRIHYGDGAGSFSGLDGAGGGLGGWAMIGDFNGDGIDDIIHTFEYTAYQKYGSVYFGGSGGLEAGPHVRLADEDDYLWCAAPPAIIDADGDGLDDVASIDHEIVDGYFHMHISYSEGDTFCVAADVDTIALPTAFTDTTHIFGVYGADFDNDGYGDICYMHSPDTLAVLLNITPTAVPERETPAAAMRLLWNYPNPFNPQTTISFVLRARTSVDIAIYDATGALVRRLADDTVMGPGTCEISWDGTNAAGTPVASGCYWCRLSGGTRSLTRKLLLLR
ncbi:MAG: hypothetical protein JW876_06175 [Candidatus Krumholzibacteriota bacterium]|nr:hypothetical protein [Candidatus Krumholzibacteriota bacterium]